MLDQLIVAAEAAVFLVMYSYIFPAAIVALGAIALDAAAGAWCDFCERGGLIGWVVRACERAAFK